MKALGNTLAIGTSFVATSSTGVNFLITNRHNVTGRHHETGELLCTKTAAVPDSLSVWHNASSGLGQFVPVEVPLFNEDEPIWIEHPVLGEKADFVALPITTNPEIILYPYKPSYHSHMHIEPAQTVSVIGFPFGERTGASFAVWATGFIASEPEINYGGIPIFLIDCRSRPGQSGSPVILYHNGAGLLTHEDGSEVISPVSWLLGIYSGRINKESDLGIVWKTEVIAELIDYASTSVNEF